MKKNLSKESYRWYAVYIRARWEKKVCEELLRKGIDVYLPLKKERRQWSDRVKIIEEPLLRGYLFVRVSHKEYYDVLVTTGVFRYICFDGKAVAIPDNQIEVLKLFIQEANESVSVITGHVSKGDRVKISCGPFKDVCAEVIEIRGKNRLLLRFVNLGCCVHAELGKNKVELLRTKNTGKISNFI